MGNQPSILFVAADRGVAADARLELELSAIRSHPTSAELARRAVVVRFWELPDLRRRIEDLRPAVIHFSGVAPVPGGLWSQTASRQAQHWGADTVDELLAGCEGAVRCVVLSGCYQDGQAIAIARHVDHVIGMRPPVPDQAAVGFSLAFYHALGSGADVADAFYFARPVVPRFEPRYLRRSVELPDLPGIRPCTVPGYHRPVILDRTRARLRAPDRVQAGHTDSHSYIHVEHHGWVEIQSNAFRCVGDLIDELYADYLRDVVPASSYGQDWVIATEHDGFGTMLVPWQWAFPARTGSLEEVERWKRETHPAIVGLDPEDSGGVILFDKPPRWERYMLVASDDRRIYDAVRFGSKFLGILDLQRYLVRIGAGSFDPAQFRYKCLVDAISCPTVADGVVIVDAGLDLTAQLEA